MEWGSSQESPADGGQMAGASAGAMALSLRRCGKRRAVLSRVPLGALVRMSLEGPRQCRRDTRPDAPAVVPGTPDDM